MSSINSPITVSTPGFTGVSKFASSLQQVLSRSVGIASLPLNSLQAGLTALNDRQSALQSLDITFSNLRQSISSLQSTLQSGLLSATISTGSVVTANVSSAATEGAYSIEVENLGSWSTALSTAGAIPVTDPSTQGIAADPYVTLSVGITPTRITPASSSLQDLATAINSQAGDQVHATLVNVGTTAHPDYRLSLTAVKLGTDAIDLTSSSGASLISSSTPGIPASYKIDGAPSIFSDNRTVTLSPGVTLNLVGQSLSGQPATVSVHHDASTLTSAIASFAYYFNAAATAVKQQHGSGGGVLQGDSLLSSLQNTLSQLATYSNGTPEGSLANFGITVSQTGQLSVNSSALTIAASSNFSGLLSTLGSTTTTGFLKTASDLLKGVEDAVIGSIPSQESTVAKQITAQNAKISAEQATVTLLQTNLTAQIAKADSVIASLESRVSYVTGLFATFTGANNTQNNGLSTL